MEAQPPSGRQQRRRLDDAAGPTNGNTSPSTTSCPAGWNRPAPASGPLPDANAETGRTCSPTGTSGTWNAASGSFRRLAAVAGRPAPRTRASRSSCRWHTPATGGRHQGLGVFLDDSDPAWRESRPSFETRGTKTAGRSPAHPRAAPPRMRTIKSSASRAPASGGGRSRHRPRATSVLQGYGVEGITGQQDRNDIMARTMQYLLR